MRPDRLAAIAAIAAVGGGLAAALALAVTPRGGAFAECPGRQVVGAEIGGPLTLTDATGARVTEAEVIAGPTLVYFGYTFCPDVCPLDMDRNAVAVDLMSEAGVAADIAFITVDPARDTPDIVGEFAEYAHENARGYTGSDADIVAAVQAYGAYRFVPPDPEDDLYLVDHSAYTYLMAPEIGLLTYFESGMPPEDVADTAACYISAL